MKKKTIICMVLLCCTMLPVMAVEGKVYRDYLNGYGGIAWAIFEDRIELRYNGERDLLSELLHKYDLIMQEIVVPTTLPDFVRTRYDVKLTKEEIFLLWSALHEYELSDGEMYAVNLSPENIYGKHSSMMVVAVLIKDNCTSCEYIATEWRNSPKS